MSRQVPESVEQLTDPRVEPVGGEQQMRIYNELLMREHPRGAEPLAGRQLRYLIASEHGVLGATGEHSVAAREADDPSHDALRDGAVHPRRDEARLQQPQRV
ncbi:MAG: DUF4338 domain-containing protein [Candidatus Schekmanbacteria bacterium]|nr:DUF4338 domain-containing protein [Candidatus Schekmanbacteria bacterium]